MSTQLYPPQSWPTAPSTPSPRVMSAVVPLARTLFALIFLLAPLGHFSRGTIDAATAQGVPLAGVLVPASGVLALVGGLSVALGFHARAGAWLLVAFLVPVTLVMHRFWGLADAHAAMLQQVMFLKNVSMLGGALLIAWFGSGPSSLDEPRREVTPPV